MIALAADARAQFGLGQPLPLHAVMFGQQLLALTQHGGVAEPVGPDHTLVDHVAGDRVVGDALADTPDCFGGEPEQRLRACLAQLVEQRLLAQRVAGEDEAAVAAGCAETDLLAFQQHHVAHTALGQPERRVQAGKAATDDGNTRVRVALKWRPGRVRRGRGAVVGRG